MAFLREQSGVQTRATGTVGRVHDRLRCKVMVRALAGSVEKWALDSGASRFLLNAKNTGLVERYMFQNVRLDTLLGEAGVNKSAAIRDPGFDEKHSALVIPNTPNCMSMGRLIEDHGYEVTWKIRKALLKHPTGKKTVLEIIDYVPFMPVKGCAAEVMQDLPLQTQMGYAIEFLKKFGRST